MSTSGQKVVTLILLFIMAVVAFLLKAYYVTLAWKWLIVPLFELAQISYHQAVAVVLLSGLLRAGFQGNYVSEDKTLQDKLISYFAAAILGPALGLAVLRIIAWIIV